MEEWRRRPWQGEQQHGWFHHQKWGSGPTRPPRYGGRPPPSPGSWHQTVPWWEKKFFTTVCSIPWKTLCETKKLMYMYKNVVQWDDSAGEEAFHNAKARFWAELNGFHCDIPLPDPDQYIDVVNPNTVIDPQLVEDLYDEQPTVSEDGESVVIWDSFLFSDKPVPVTGWGDEDDPVPTNDAAAEPQPAILFSDKPVPVTGWGDEDDPVPTNDAAAEPQPAKNLDSGDALNPVSRVANCEEKIDSFYALNSAGKEINSEYGNGGTQNGGCGDGVVQDNSFYASHSAGKEINSEYGNGRTQNGGCGDGVVQDNSWTSGRDNSRVNNGRDNSVENWEKRNDDLDRRYGRKRDGGGRFGLKYKKNCRGRKRTNYTCEQSVHDKLPLDMPQWNSMCSCGPMNHQGSAESRGSWRWQKSVS